MGRRAKEPYAAVAPVSSRKQLMDGEAVRKFLGGISSASFDRIRNDPGQRFPPPVQILGNKLLWTLEQLERYVDRKVKEVEALST
jgi:predicted DNA-binding transcriptional regulator AlpA